MDISRAPGRSNRTDGAIASGLVQGLVSIKDMETRPGA